MIRITTPRSGVNFRITKRGYIDGIFIIEGVRVYKGLGPLSQVEVGPNGRRRTPQQVNKAIQTLWEDKRLDLQDADAKRRAYTGSMQEAFDAWIAHAEGKGRARSTIRGHELTRESYLQIVGDHALEEGMGNPPRYGYDLRRADAYLRGLREQGLGNVRINMYLGQLSSALRHAYRRGMLERIPIIERLKTERKPTRVPTPEQLQALAQRLNRLATETRNRRQRYAYQLHRLLFYLLLGTGMRRSEAFYLRRDQVDLARRAIHLVRTKTGEPRVCRIPVFLQEVLAEHFAEFPDHVLLFEHLEKPGEHAYHDPMVMTTAFGRHLTALGMAGSFKVLHGFRALFSTAGLNNVGVDPVTMQSQLGHADLSTTIRYYVAGLQDAQLRAVDAMEAGFFTPLLQGGASPHPEPSRSPENGAKPSQPGLQADTKRDTREPY